MKFSFVVILGLTMQTGAACELCAIYSADSAHGESTRGFVFTMSEQFVPYRTSQFEGHEVSLANPSYVDSSMSHAVLGYNFTSRFGVSFNLPITYLNFRRTELRYSTAAPPVQFTETGTEFGLGDAALIGRLTVFHKVSMPFGFTVNLLAGVKFPTGDASRLDEEIEQERIFQSFLPRGTPHDPLSHSISSVHPHDLALGSGSYDGVFGTTIGARWGRFFANGQFQYYLRTQGQAEFQYGDELIVSGGPGAYVLLRNSITLNLQANAVYDTLGRDQLSGQTSNRTGSTAWYLGPLVSLTWGEHFSANAGVDLPLRIDNRGFQSVPDYRVHGGFAWRF